MEYQHQWRVVDTPLLQPRDGQKVVFADRGPWCTNLALVLRNAQWLENTGREVWIEQSGKTWLNAQGQPTTAPPQHYSRKPKGGY